jgi:hypothetical protein
MLPSSQRNKLRSQRWPSRSHQCSARPTVAFRERRASHPTITTMSLGSASRSDPPRPAVQRWMPPSSLKSSTAVRPQTLAPGSRLRRGQRGIPAPRQNASQCLVAFKPTAIHRCCPGLGRTPGIPSKALLKGPATPWRDWQPGRRAGRGQRSRSYGPWPTGTDARFRSSSCPVHRHGGSNRSVTDESDALRGWTRAVEAQGMLTLYTSTTRGHGVPRFRRRGAGRGPWRWLGRSPRGDRVGLDRAV